MEIFAQFLKSTYVFHTFVVCSILSDAEYRNALSEGVLRMQESGKLATLKIKWWKEKKGGGACQVTMFKNMLLLFVHLANGEQSQTTELIIYNHRK